MTGKPHLCRAFISKQAAFALAVIIAATGLLVWEWHYAHRPKSHAVPAADYRQEVGPTHTDANPAGP